MIIIAELAQLYVTGCLIGLVLVSMAILVSVGPILLYPVAKPVDQLLVKLRGGRPTPPPPPWWGPVGACLLMLVGVVTWLAVT